MKNVTISLDEKTASWARKHAAEKGVSLSRFIGEVLQKDMRRARDYERARRLFFSVVPAKLKGPGERYPTREELYDRGRLR
ncbi:MAG TPA: CopG family transcriptional regulator [Gammaproteobacteria bacterium]|nr:CopG family transcriptional regulator [Gammaproteobacteria bacterium]